MSRFSYSTHPPLCRRGHGGTVVGHMAVPPAFSAFPALCGLDPPGIRKMTNSGPSCESHIWAKLPKRFAEPLFVRVMVIRLLVMRILFYVMTIRLHAVRISIYTSALRLHVMKILPRAMTIGGFAAGIRLHVIRFPRLGRGLFHREIAAPVPAVRRCPHEMDFQPRVIHNGVCEGPVLRMEVDVPPLTGPFGYFSNRDHFLAMRRPGETMTIRPPPVRSDPAGMPAWRRATLYIYPTALRSSANRAYGETAGSTGGCFSNPGSEPEN